MSDADLEALARNNGFKAFNELVVKGKAKAPAPGQGSSVQEVAAAHRALEMIFCGGCSERFNVHATGLYTNKSSRGS